MVLLALLAAGLLAATLWLWPILGRRRPAFIALRIALLVGLQISVIGAVFVWVNRSNEFYTSWSDLLGTDHIGGTVVAVQPAPAASAQPADQGAPLVTLASSQVVAPGVPPGTGGRLEKVRFTGPVSGITVSGHVYLPPGYAAGSRPLPVIVIITRQADSSTASYGAPQVAAAAAAQIRAGRMAPAIIAVLPPTVAGRNDQGCLNSPSGPQAATFFTQDLPQALMSTYHAAPGPSGWAVLGGAGGGYCALQLATASSGQFSVAAAAPGTYTVPPGRGETDKSRGLISQDNLLWRLRHWPPPPVQVLFDGPGRAQQFTALVRPPMTVATARQAAGQPSLPPVLDWIGHALAGHA